MKKVHTETAPEPPAEEKRREGAHPGDAPASPPAAEAPAPPSVPPAAETDAKAEEPLKTQLLRLQADFDNFRKRTARERMEIGARAQEALIAELLPALDHYRLGLESARRQAGAEQTVKGFQLIWDQLWNVLQRFGLASIDAVGQIFDPAWHESIRQVASAEHPEGVVVEQTRPGYRLGDRLLQPTQVIVSSGPGPDQPPESE